MKFSSVKDIFEDVPGAVDANIEVYKKPEGTYGIKSDNVATYKGGIPSTTKMATQKVLKYLKSQGLLNKLDPDNEQIKDIQPMKNGDVKVFFDNGGSEIVKFADYSRM